MTNRLFLRNLFHTTLAITALFQLSFGQSKPAASGAILQGLKKLNVVGTVLYVAAHPDDENTQLLTYLANERLLRTGYLALTRGDGGQNLIGSEQGEYIGVIRTQELLAARRIDGPDQFFSRANDFGFSKSTDEAVRMWGQEQILGDVVWMIRKYRPDVIITRFPPDSRAGHGHHSASAYLAEEAFKIANDPTKYPEQLKWVKPWQPKRIFWNVFIPGAFMSNKKPDEPGVISVETGLYNPLLGKSYGEIAAESRSQHKSQGFGVPASRGVKIDYLLLKGGEPAPKDPFDGVDLSWKRVPGSAKVQQLINQAITNFKSDKPSASVPVLVQTYKALAQLDTANLYVKAKRQEVEKLIQQCIGLWYETNPADFAASPGEQIRVASSIVNRSDYPVKLLGIQMPAVKKDTAMNLALKPNDVVAFNSAVTIPANQPISQPYWLEKPVNKGLFQVSNQALIGSPENPPAFTTAYSFEIDGQRFVFTQPWSYKSTDPVDGEIYRPFIIQPAVMANLAEKVYVFADDTPKNVDVVLRAGRTSVSGTLKLEVPSGWRVEPEQIPFNLKEKSQEVRVSFRIYPSTTYGEGRLRAVVSTTSPEKTGYASSLRVVAYKHIPTQTLFPAAEAKLVKLDIKVKSKNIGYIAGAGDEVPAALQQIGCVVTPLTARDMNSNLSVYDAIVVGVRAYNTEDWLRNAQPKLLDYVEKGGTMIVQYVTPGGSFIQNGLKTSQLGPYPFVVGRERVTEEDATMTFINPQHPLLNTPNKITEQDFNGWVQERGIYFAQEWDKAYEPIFSAHDVNEASKDGSLIYCKYGKGHYMYTGLVFFRELPAGVPGAYRLFANMISVGK
ncbi:PIG-L family deacetylase [Larkinella terrae]|uniref:LmbE family protein n=1 Tax=Larkinella terrae TaxID=2025311 RepID=A0A7K0EL92_9BACT|nr:PIG-L family deacetylase [Larkinella terrae]MRS62587.1 LmbE family protein [Larkinella terrae]